MFSDHVRRDFSSGFNKPRSLRIRYDFGRYPPANTVPAGRTYINMVTEDPVLKDVNSTGRIGKPSGTVPPSHRDAYGGTTKLPEDSPRDEKRTGLVRNRKTRVGLQRLIDCCCCWCTTTGCVFLTILSEFVIWFFFFFW